MSDENISAFEALLDEELHLIDKFQEHLSFAGNLVDDENTKAFFKHLVDEENEHRDQIQSLKDRARNLGSVQTHMHSQVPTQVRDDSGYGHFQRRDQNVLTVGSLYGARQ
jgi:hypothetical protein